MRFLNHSFYSMWLRSGKFCHFQLYKSRQMMFRFVFIFILKMTKVTSTQIFPLDFVTFFLYFMLFFFFIDIYKNALTSHTDGANVLAVVTLTQSKLAEQLNMQRTKQQILYTLHIWKLKEDYPLKVWYWSGTCCVSWFF